jgi:hypothetical protein
MNVNLARKSLARNIARNPTTIVIQRGVMEKEDGAGGSIKVPNILPSQTVRIFISSLDHKQTAKEGGQIQVQRWGMVATHETDIQKGDTFSVNSRKFRVRGITETSTAGQLIGFQVDLEEVI